MSFAQEEDYLTKSLEELCEIKVVSASRYSQKVTEAPATIYVITDKDIQERGYQNLVDIFRDMPGIDYTHNGNMENGLTLITSRGLLGNQRFQVFLNGKRLNSPAGEPFVFAHQTPLHYVKRVEVMFGPGSAVYGADAFSGVINIITKSADEIKGVEASTAYGTAQTSINDFAIGSKINDFSNFVLSGRIYDSDGYNLRTSHPEHFERSFHEGYDSPIRGSQIFGQLSLGNFQVELQRWNSKESSSAGETPKTYYYTSDAFWDLTKDTLAASYVTGGENLQSTTRLIFERYEMDPESNYSLIYGKAYKYTFAKSSRVDQQLDYTPSESLKFSAGFVYEDISSLPKAFDLPEPVKTKRPNYIQNPTPGFDGIGTVNYENIGVFAQSEYNIIKELKLIGGIRYDYNSSYNESINPRVGAIYQVSNDSTIKLLYGTAYLAPTPYKKYNFWMTDSYGHITNPDLKAEEVKSYELSFSHKIGKSVIGQLSLFRNNANRLMVDRFYGLVLVRGTPHPVESTINSGELTSQGVELSSTLLFSEFFKGRFAYTLIDGEVRENGETIDLPRVSRHKVNMGLTAALWEKGTWDIGARWVSDITTQPANSQYGSQYGGNNKMPGNFVVNTNIRVKNIVKNLDAFLTVENLLNKKYYELGMVSENDDYSIFTPTIPQNGRMFLAGVKYKFDF